MNIKLNKGRVVLLCLLIASIVSCSKERKIQRQMWKGLQLPAHFGTPVYNMSDNAPTESGFKLGKRLFYDPILSRNNTISCGSCHQQAFAFTQHGHDLSHGIDDKLGRRNSLPIQNLLWQKDYFWDGGVHNLDLIPVNAITNPVEMDSKVADVVAKLNTDKEYVQMFEKAFGDPEITGNRMLQALSQFMGLLISANSKYDQFLLGKTSLTSLENSGMELFNQKCASCHSGIHFSNGGFANNGISNDFSKDKGRFEISTLAEDMGKFKVPSLRNVARTGPYMHDGSYNTLEAVLEHYNSGVKVSPTLDTLLMKSGALGIPLTAQEKSSVVAFLNTLTDTEFLTNPLFSEY